MGPISSFGSTPAARRRSGAPCTALDRRAVLDRGHIEQPLRLLEGRGGPRLQSPTDIPERRVHGGQCPHEARASPRIIRALRGKNVEPRWDGALSFSKVLLR